MCHFPSRILRNDLPRSSSPANRAAQLKIQMRIGFDQPRDWPAAPCSYASAPTRAFSQHPGEQSPLSVQQQGIGRPPAPISTGIESGEMRPIRSSEHAAQYWRPAPPSTRSDIGAPKATAAMPNRVSCRVNRCHSLRSTNRNDHGDPRPEPPVAPLVSGNQTHVSSSTRS